MAESKKAWLKVDDEFHKMCKGIATAFRATGNTQKDVVATTGIDQTTVSRVMTGHYAQVKAQVITPELFDKIGKLAVLFNVPVPQLRGAALRRRSGEYRTDRPQSARDSEKKAPEGRIALLKMVAQGMASGDLTREEASILLSIK